jgi:hypothetical protein
MAGSSWRTETKEHSNPVLWKVASGAGMIFCCVVLGFLLFADASFFSVDRGSMVVTAVFSFCCPVAAAAAARALWAKIPSQFRRIVLYSGAVSVLFLFVACAPFSPSHDSYDMMGFLEQALAGNGYTGYARAYLSFTATNRIAMFFYLPSVFLFQSVELGVRVSHFMLLSGSILLLAESCRSVFSEAAGETAVYVLLAFCPYVLLVGPYIYLPAIFLSALAFYLLHHKGIFFKAAGVLSCGLLYVLRPLALGWILLELLFLFWTGHYKHRFLSGIGVVAGILVSCVLFHGVFAALLYHTGLYPYKGLQTSAGLWTLELGTRWQGEETGTCTYSGYSEPGFDQVSKDFHTLWQLYEKSDMQDIEQIKHLQTQIKEQILQRSQQTILADVPSFWSFLKLKFTNYFADAYRPYYYIPNINSPDISRELESHYEKQYFLYENMLLTAFYTAALGTLAHYFARPEKQKQLLGLLMGVFATVGISIVATEVGKRLLFDAFVPMVLVLCAQAGNALQQLQQKLPGKTRRVAGGGMALTLLLTIGIQGAYHQYRFPIFRGSRFEISGERIVLRLKKTAGEHLLVQQGETVQDFYGKQELAFENKPGNDTHFLRFQFPDGEEYTVAKLRRQK